MPFSCLRSSHLNTPTPGRLLVPAGAPLPGPLVQYVAETVADCPGEAHSTGPKAGKKSRPQGALSED